MTVTPVVGETGALEHYIAILRDIAEKKLYERKLDHLAHHDALTGLPNRVLFRDRLSNMLAHAKRTKQGLAVIFLDLDGFKHINDSLGHKIGDRILHSVAKRLTKTLREADTVARMSGDEFTIIVEDIESADGAVAAAQRIQDSFTQPFHVSGHELYVTASMGIALYPEDGKDAQSLLKASDTAMYRAKETGCNNYQVYTSEMHRAVLERVELGNGLRKAITNQEFVVYYQPRIDLRSNITTGAEALVRWIHPIDGLIPPDRFIPLAEESGLIETIGEWVLMTACAQAAKWVKNGVLNADVAVNVSARQFVRTDLVKVVERALSDTGLDPRWLSLELTESALVMEPENAVRTLHRLKNMGIGIAIDDFGTGYSSLNYLKQYPIDALKIDRSFVKEITTNPDDAAIAGAIISMAHNLCLKVVAEGVETSEQLELLRMMQCDEMQGFLLSKPLPAAEFERLINNMPKQTEQIIRCYG
jgi:diguanylate cyclase (GGDEF)-like protein